MGVTPDSSTSGSYQRSIRRTDRAYFLLECALRPLEGRDTPARDKTQGSTSPLR